MIPLPNLLQPFVNAARQLQAPWNMYLQQFTQAPPNVAPLTVGATPFLYTAKEPCNIAILGGTISGIFIIRGLVAVDVTGSKIVPLAINDRIGIDFTVAPTITFIPSYGQNTGAQ